MNNFYLLTGLFGLFGTLAMLRSIELFAVGPGVQPAQLLIAFVMLVSAGACWKKARDLVSVQR